jgi:hypothetical protein
VSQRLRVYCPPARKSPEERNRLTKFLLCFPSRLSLLEYDQGGRFDLKLPHCDIGYESEDADVMGKIGKLFGFGKSKTKDDTRADSS